MNNFPSREDYDPYFYDPEGERDAQARREHMYDNDDWEFAAMRDYETACDRCGRDDTSTGSDKS
jgi:hypothetical protein